MRVRRNFYSRNFEGGEPWKLSFHSGLQFGLPVGIDIHPRKTYHLDRSDSVVLHHNVDGANGWGKGSIDNRDTSNDELGPRPFPFASGWGFFNLGMCIKPK